MIGPQRELIVDLFAGGGGASTAILNATGRHPDIAVNHDIAAIGVHEANHPTTRHFTCDVREVDPVAACTIDGRLQPVGLLWASPDCTHFSKARGGKPVEKRIRSLADVVVDWARAVRPRLIHLENVEEFQSWGPVLENGQPCPERRGLDFRRWGRDLEALGYALDWRELVAADYGAPTTRKRLFLIARNDGEPITWPEPTHASRADLAKGNTVSSNLKPWRAAAEILDWSIPTPSIFGRKKALADKTLARIAKGIRRFVIESPAPFIVPLTHAGERPIHDLDDPLRTVTGANRGELALTVPHLTTITHGTSPARVHDPREPLRTVTTANRGEFSVVAPHVTKFRTGSVGHDVGGPLHTVTANGYEKRPGGAAPLGVATAFLARQFGSTVSGRSLGEPAPTVMTDGDGGKTGLAAVYLEQANTRDVGAAADEPARTVTGRSHQGVVAACIDKYYATGVPSDPAEPLDTATAKARFGLNAAFLEQANTGVVGHAATEPVSTILAAGCHQRLVDVRLEAVEAHAGRRRRQVLEFLFHHFGEPSESEWVDPVATPQGRLRFGLVILAGTVWQIADIGMRMLVPRELFNAQGFPRDYIIDRTASGAAVTKTAQTSLAGNSVSPPPAEASLRANLTWMQLPERRIAA